MRNTKKASEIVAGDKIFTSENPNKAREVTASYEFGDRWGLEVVGIKQILQVEKDDTLQVWSTSKPVATKDAYDVKKGDRFRVDGKEYLAEGDAHGEFRPYIPVKQSDGKVSDIVLSHGQQVEILN